MNGYVVIKCVKCGNSIFATGNEAKAISNHNRYCAGPSSSFLRPTPPPTSLLVQQRQETCDHHQQIEYQEFDFNDDIVVVNNHSEHDENVHMELFHHQQLLLSEYFDIRSNRPAFWVRTASKEYTASDPRGSWENYVRIFEYVRSNQLSQQQGTDLLELMTKVNQQYNVSIPLPLNMETVEQACMRGVHTGPRIDNDSAPRTIKKKKSKERSKKINLHPVETSSYNMSNIFFGDKTLRPVLSGRMSLPHRIAEVLLDVNPDDFFFNASSENGEISEFGHGSVFRGLDIDAKERFGPNAVALCLSISLDNATVNSTRNRSECPVVFSILNIKGIASYHLIGYCPIRLPYSDAELAAMMSKCGISNSDQSNILSYCHRQMKREYLDDILFPLLQLAEVGFKAQVGYGDSARHAIFVPHLCMIVGDTEELGRKLTGVKDQTGCRCCTTKHVNVYDPTKLADHSSRNDVEMDRITSDGATVFLKKYESYKMGIKPFLMTDQDREMLKKLEESGLHAGENPLYKYFERQRSLHLNSYHDAVVPDHLHTVQLGVICHCVSWVMQVVFAVKYLDPDTYKENVAKIDDRIINIETVHSYDFIKSTHFRWGISQFFGAYSTSAQEVAQQRGTGLSTGTIHAWQYSTLLLHLYFSLVPCSGILPNDFDWWKVKYKTLGDENPEDGSVNIFETVISAITCCLDFYFLSTKRCFDDDSFNIFRYVIGNMRIQLHVLDRMRRYLCKMLKKKFPGRSKGKTTGGDPVFTGTKPEPVFTGIKPHLCEHMLHNVKKFGPIIVSSDTQLTERLLKYVCKSVFQQTSKKYKNIRGELIAQYLKNCRAFALSKSLDRREAYRNRTEMVHEEVAAEYHFFSGFGFIALHYNGNKIWKFLLNSDSREMSEKASSVHEFLDASRLVQILSSTKSITSHVFSNMQSIMKSNEETHQKYGLLIKTYKGVTIYNRHHIKDSKAENEPFTLHCNATYKVGKEAVDYETRPVFSFIEVNYTSGHDQGCSYCQVLAIVEISLEKAMKEDESIRRQQYLVVARMSYRPSGSPLPFGLYGYESQGNAIDLIPIGSAFRPCIAYRYYPRPNVVTFITDALYFVIPYDRFGKTTNTNWKKHGRESVISQYAIDERTSMKTTSFPMYATIQQQQNQMRDAHQRQAAKMAQKQQAVKRSRPKSSTVSSKKQRINDDTSICVDEEVEEEEDEEEDDDII